MVMHMPKLEYLSKSIDIPEDVKVEIDENRRVKVTGPLGTIEKDFSHIPKKVNIKIENGKVIVDSYDVTRREKAIMGTIIAHFRNMFKGVREGYVYKMKIVYTHFPIKVEVKGDKVIINNFMGERAPRIAKILKGVEVKVEGEDVIVKGIDKDAVGQTAANIQQATRIKDKDPRVFLDGIYVYEKDGKPLVR